MEEIDGEEIDEEGGEKDDNRLKDLNFCFFFVAN